MSENIDLYKLELTEDPYSAKFIVTPPEDLPDGCVLPGVVGYTPLPPLALVLPDLTCRFDIDTPIIPPPYYCTPAIEGEIGIISCEASDNNVPVTITNGTATITRKEGTDCDYELTGEIELCVPICIKQFDVRQEITANGCNGPSEITVTWESNCLVELNTDGAGFVAVPSSGVAVYTSSHSLTFRALCCEEKLVYMEVEIGGGGTTASGSVDFEQGETGIGSITLSKVGCNIEISGGPITIPISNATDVNETVPGIATGICESSASWLHLTKSIGVDDEVIIELTGGFPFPCFTCDPLNTGGTYVSTINIEKLKPKEIKFDNSCCDNTYSYWTECGKEFKVGDQTIGGDHGFKVDMSISNSAITYTHSGLLFQMTKDELMPPIDEGVQGVRPRELDFCDNGTPKKVIVLCSQPYTPTP